MIIKKYGITFEQMELNLKEPGPEQLSLEFEFSELAAADDLNLNHSKQNQKRRTNHADNNYN